MSPDRTGLRAKGYLAAHSLWIPGIFSRMGSQRCPACCDAVRMPHGKQSPKNIDECRPVAEARIAALAA